MDDTRKPVLRSLTLVAFALAAAGCQLFVDLNGLEDRACPPGRKACGDGCVSESDPATGCNDPLCNPCAFSHANAICDQRNRCSFTPEDCIMPWAACDVADDNGCETDLAHDKDNCGECGKVCPERPHATGGCSNMAGMCLGSLGLARYVGRNRHPLRIYALLEILIAVSGLLMLAVMPLVQGIYTAISPHGIGGLLLRGVFAAICLIPPTVMMGATLPAVARWVETTPRGVSWLGFFYGGNIAGAVLGCVLAGFYLLRDHDMRR